MERKTSIFLLSVGLLSQISAFVPPATKLSLDCRNFENTLRWDYSQHAALKPRFRVQVKALTGKLAPLLVDYPNLQCDLSSFSRPDNDYIVSVTALVGQNESLPAPPDGLSFSYFHSSLTNVKCSLDLPSVNVTIQSEAGIKFSFSHPSVLYSHKLLTKPKRRQKKPDESRAKRLSVFEYSVVVTSNKMEYGLSCETEVCGDIIPAGLQQEKHCVKIDGYWENMAVHSTQDSCARALPAPTFSYTSVYIGLVAFSSVAILGLVFAFCFRRVTGFSPLPSSLLISQSFSRTNHDLQQDVSHTPLIPDHASVSPVSPVTCTPGIPFMAPAGNQEMVGPVGSTITAADKAPERPLPNGKPAVPNGSAPWAPGADPVAVAHGVGPRAGDDPGVAAGDAGPGQPDAGVEEGAPELEPLGEAPCLSGYEQRATVVRVEFTDGDFADAYHF